MSSWKEELTVNQKQTAILDNALKTSDPEYQATLIILAHANIPAKGKTEQQYTSFIKEARKVAKLLVKEFKLNE